MTHSQAVIPVTSQKLSSSVYKKTIKRGQIFKKYYHLQVIAIRIRRFKETGEEIGYRIALSRRSKKHM
jgi:hypothetical protein